MQSLADGKEYEDPREEEIRNQILSLKEKSKPYIEELRNTKAAYETLEIIQKRLTEQLTKDFERWRLQFVARRQNQIKAIDSSLLTSSIKDTEVTKNL